MKGPVASKEYVDKKMSIYETKAKKKYGQNFLIDDEIAAKIVGLLKEKKDSTIIEIGPGLGALTYHLVKKNTNLKVVELDERMVEHLNSEINEPNVEIIHQDFLKYDLNKINSGIYIIGNIPYYITGEIIEKIVRYPNVKQIVLMVQKEAYYRYVSPINSKDYTPISIFIDYLGGATLVSNISKNAYWPRPHVDSVVFEINVSKKRIANNERLFFKVTKSMFLMRRKTILNNLSSYLKDKNKAKMILQKLNCLETKRPEQLDLNFYLDLTDILSIL